MQIFNNITTYIPQRPPFVMVDKLLSVTETETVSEFTISEENLFCENNCFFESGIIENIAQTVAAGAGYRSYLKGESPAIGMIGSIKKLSITKRPQKGSTLQTTVKVIMEMDNAMVVEGVVMNGHEGVAGCQMNIFLIKN